MSSTLQARTRSVVDVRTPPHSVEAEQSVLGGLLIEAHAWDNVGDVVRAEDFYRPDHRTIFEALATLAAEGKPLDVITVSEALQRAGKLDSVGGLAYLGTLARDTPTAANVRAYAEIVRERSLLRQLIETGTNIAASVFNNEGDTAKDLVERAEQQIFEIAEQGTRRASPMVAARDLLPPLIDKIDEWNKNPGGMRGLPTGFIDFDRKTGGLRGGDLVIVAGRPSMGKCIVSGSRILDPQTGALETIDTRVRQRHANLVSLDSRGRLRPSEASDFVDDGVKPVYEVRTALGRRVVVTASHPFLTPSGWQPMAALRTGMHIAVPRELPFFGQHKLPDSLVKLAAYFITDGGLTDKVPKFTNARPRVLKDFIAAVGHFPGIRCRIETSHGTRAPTANVVRDLSAIGEARRAFAERFKHALSAAGWSLHALARTLGVTAGAVHAWKSGTSAPGAALLPRLSALGFEISTPSGSGSIHKNGDNPVKEWLVTLGLWGKSAHAKRVPDVIFELSREQLALFLNRAFACDGSIYVQNGDQPAISYSTVNEALARDVQHLLLRFGIIAKLRSRSIRYRDTRRPAFELRIVRQEDIERFVREIGIFGKETAASEAMRISSAKRRKVNLDVIPPEVWALIERRKGEWTWSDLAAALGQGEGGNLHVGKRGLSRPRLRRIAELLGDAELADLASSDIYWDRIVALEYVGERQVYDLTVPVHHNFVAEDVLVHNTTLAVNMAENAALDPKVAASVLLFSMEMPAEQLLMRMMSSLGRVPLNSIRNGRMSDDDWVRLTGATQQLGGAKVFIDETPALTPTELRARARRIKREHGLHLVVVDYLQLMQVPGTQENRATEIAEISRGLKALAKELNVPVIALSQLNRGVEQRVEKRPVMSDLRECVTGDTRVCLADGRRVLVRDLVGTEPEVWSIDEYQCITRARSDKVWHVGRRAVFRVQLASGRSIRATAEHRLMAGDGWKTIAQLSVGDRLALARQLPEPASTASWPDHWIVLLGHLIGDGSFLNSQPLRYATASEENSAAVRAAAEAFGSTVKRYAGRGKWHQLLISGNGNRWHPAGVGKWLKDLGIFGQRSHEKHLPAEVFSLPNSQIALLLRHLWATDGSIVVRPAGKRGGHRIYFSTCSDRLASDVAALLLRLGIVARLRTVIERKGRPTITVDVVGSEPQRRFLTKVGAHGPRAVPAARLANLLEAVVANPNVDTLPQSIFADVQMRMRCRGMTGRAVASMRGTAYGGSSHFSFAPSRRLVGEYAELLESRELATWSESDLFWDRVVEITPDGVEDVYDLTVPGPSNWVTGEGVVTHNSGSLEQDSDMILLIYREEVYDKNTAKKGVAEVDLAKHRNGETGTMLLTFRGEITKFENYQDPAYAEGILR